MRRLLNKLVFSALLVGVFSARAQNSGLPEFPVHFVVLTGNPQAQAVTGVDALKAEVEILNKYFRTAGGEALVNFTFKSASLYADIKDSKCDIAAMGDAPENWRPPKYLSPCQDEKIVAPGAVLFLIFDAWNPEKKFDHIDSLGGYFKNRPFVMLDWARLGHKTQSPEEHEMGHAFGLAHVCVPGAKISSSTNIMASHDKCPGSSGGRRDLGFTKAQVATIQGRIMMYRKSLGL